MSRTTLSTLLLLLAVIVGVPPLPGCASSRARGPYSASPGENRDPQLSRELTAKAKEVWASHPERAEKLLRDALDADLFNGPAHNNLGVLLLKQGRLYDAASEFEWGRKLLPGHPDPRVNLALTLEKAGKTDSAMDAYDSALAVHDGYLPALQGRARLQILSGRRDRVNVDDLQQIALRGDPEWQAWARLWSTKLFDQAGVLNQ